MAEAIETQFPVDRSPLVTGASSGLGRCFALAEMGGEAIVVARRADKLA